MKRCRRTREEWKKTLSSFEITILPKLSILKENSGWKPTLYNQGCLNQVEKNSLSNEVEKRLLQNGIKAWRKKPYKREIGFSAAKRFSSTPAMTGLRAL